MIKNKRWTYLRLTRSAHRLERRSALNLSTLMATVVYTEMDLKQGRKRSGSKLI